MMKVIEHRQMKNMCWHTSQAVSIAEQGDRETIKANVIITIITDSLTVSLGQWK